MTNLLIKHKYNVKLNSVWLYIWFIIIAIDSTDGYCYSTPYNDTSDDLHCDTECGDISPYIYCSNTTLVNDNGFQMCKCCDCDFYIPTTTTSTSLTRQYASNMSCSTTSINVDFFSNTNCNETCGQIYGLCTATYLITGIFETQCECCNCTIPNDCGTFNGAAVDNPLKHHEILTYVFLTMFFILCVIPLWFFAFKNRVKQQKKKGYGLINKFVHIIDDNGYKQSCCKYLCYQHSVLKLRCGSRKNRPLMWSSFIFDHVLAFSSAILFATLSYAVNFVNCQYENGQIVKDETSYQSDGNEFSYNFKDQVLVLVVKHIYGFFIGKIVDIEFKHVALMSRYFKLMLFEAALFLIITVIIRLAYDLKWNMNQYVFLFVTAQLQDMIFVQVVIIYAKFLIGNWCVDAPAPDNVSNTNVGYQLMTDDANISEDININRKLGNTDQLMTGANINDDNNINRKLVSRVNVIGTMLLQSVHKNIQ
eukprot:2623_1